MAVIILVVLIKTLGLTELVSDDLGSRKQKEAETNAKIVDLFKDRMRLIRQWTFVLNLTRTWNYCTNRSKSETRFSRTEICAS